MVCCLLCFSDSPMPGDFRAAYGNRWSVSMMNAPCQEPGAFCCAFVPCCQPISQYNLRKKALGGDLTNYKCCQGYMDNACCKAGRCGDNGSCLHLCVEVVCCPGCAISATRQLVMDTRDITPDPCDNRIIRFNNCLQILSCIMRILAKIETSLEDAADLLDIAAECTFYCTAGCMTAQTEHELNQLGNTRALNWHAAQQAQQNKLQAAYAKRGGGSQQAPQVVPYRATAPQAQVMAGRVQPVQMQPQYVMQQQQQQQQQQPQYVMQQQPQYVMQQQQQQQPQYVMQQQYAQQQYAQQGRGGGRGGGGGGGAALAAGAVGGAAVGAGLMYGAQSGAFDGAGAAIGGAAGAVGDFAGDAAGAVGGFASDAYGAAGDMMGGAGDVMGDAAGAVGDFAGDVGDAVGDFFG